MPFAYVNWQAGLGQSKIPGLLDEAVAGSGCGGHVLHVTLSCWWNDQEWKLDQSLVEFDSDAAADTFLGTIGRLSDPAAIAEAGRGCGSDMAPYRRNYP